MTKDDHEEVQQLVQAVAHGLQQELGEKYGTPFGVMVVAVTIPDGANSTEMKNAAPANASVVGMSHDSMQHLLAALSRLTVDKSAEFAEGSGRAEGLVDLANKGKSH